MPHSSQQTVRKLAAKIAHMEGHESIIQCVVNSDSIERGVVTCAEGLLELLEKGGENDLFVPDGADLFALVKGVSPDRRSQLSALREALRANLGVLDVAEKPKDSAVVGHEPVAA